MVTKLEEIRRKAVAGLNEYEVYLKRELENISKLKEEIDSHYTQKTVSKKIQEDTNDCRACNNGEGLLPGRVCASCGRYKSEF